MKDTKYSQPGPDWNPTSPEVQRDQRAAYDEMRRRCPVAHSEFMGWSLFRHEDVTRVLRDHKTFSNAVSQHLSVPDDMDPPEHPSSCHRTLFFSGANGSVRAHLPRDRREAG